MGSGWRCTENTHKIQKTMSGCLLPRMYMLAVWALCMVSNIVRRYFIFNAGNNQSAYFKQLV